MGIISWIFMGAIAGWLAHKITGPNGKKHGCISNILLGIIGAFIGGFIMSLLGGYGVTGFNLRSIIVATLGAVVLIWIGRSIKN